MNDKNKFDDNLLCNMQYYMEYCQRNGYITPEEWLTNHKHYKDSKNSDKIYNKEYLIRILRRLENDLYITFYKNIDLDLRKEKLKEFIKNL